MNSTGDTLKPEERMAQFGELVIAEQDAVSQWPSSFRYVVQAWSNLDGWQDSKYGGQFPETAEGMAARLLANDASWMGQKRLVRIVPAKSLR